MGAQWHACRTDGECAETLSKLQAARVGVPAHTPPHDTRRADQAGRSFATASTTPDAHRGLEQLTVLAQRCEQSATAAAIRRAKSPAFRHTPYSDRSRRLQKTPSMSGARMKPNLMHTRGDNALPEAAELPAGSGIRARRVSSTSPRSWSARKLKADLTSRATRVIARRDAMASSHTAAVRTNTAMEHSSCGLA